MSTIVLENTPTVIDLANEAKTRGWSITPDGAVHESCNAGFISVVNTVFTPVSGQSYTVSYQIDNYTSGDIQLSIGNTLGTIRSSNGFFTETLTASGVDPLIRFYSNGSLRVRTIDVRASDINTDNKKRNTIVFSEVNNKWSSFLSFTSDFGLSLFENLFTFKGGRMYRHDPDILPRNNIYGVQYKTIVNMPFNMNKGQPKTFESISYEGNMLLITTTGGVVTSLGQFSNLISEDFLRETLDDGVTQVDVYDDEGVFAASFMREANAGDVINGSNLKGTYLKVELITTENGVLILKNVMVNSVPSYIGSR